MISWVWIPVAFIIGGLFGVMIYAVCAYDNATRKDTKWWDENE